MHDYVHWHCTIDYCVKLIFVNETFCKKLLLFHTEREMNSGKGVLSGKQNSP